MLNQLCIIGVGLIGGSMARALRAAGYCREIVGCSRDEQHLQRAVKLGVIDRYETDITRAVSGADMVVVSVPLGSIRTVLQQLAPALPAGAVVTDVGSAKESVVADAAATLGEHIGNFVAGHPIAGTEQSGVEASFAELFSGRRVILTPTEATSADALEKVREMWRQTGAEVQDMEVHHHDEVLAATSHLPHVLAFSLVDTLASMGDRDEIFQYAAGGFRDFTRIASSDPVMWRDICLANRDALLKVLERYQQDLSELAQYIHSGDGDSLLAKFTRAKQARDRNTE